MPGALSLRQRHGADRPGRSRTPVRHETPIASHELRDCRRLFQTLADIAGQP
jgi:hypothetical protein